METGFTKWLFTFQLEMIRFPSHFLHFKVGSHAAYANLRITIEIGFIRPRSSNRFLHFWIGKLNLYKKDCSQ